MSKADRSRVVRLAEAQVGIPGPDGEHSVSFLQRGTLNVKLSLPVPPTNRRRTHRTRSTLSSRRGVLLHDGERDTFRVRRPSFRGCRKPSIVSRTLPRTSLCGFSSTPPWWRGPRLERGARV